MYSNELNKLNYSKLEALVSRCRAHYLGDLRLNRAIGLLIHKLPRLWNLPDVATLEFVIQIIQQSKNSLTDFGFELFIIAKITYFVPDQFRVQFHLKRELFCHLERHFTFLTLGLSVGELHEIVTTCILEHVHECKTDSEAHICGNISDGNVGQMFITTSAHVA